jgi:hypothetical protein
MQEIKNARIHSVSLGKESHDILTAFLNLDFDGFSQGFGGYQLYNNYQEYYEQGNYAGFFIKRCLEVVGADRWENLAGKTIRVKTDGYKLLAIGNIIKDIWFEPAVEIVKEKNK